ncbi:MAG: NAD-dependent epimerase/dehydratase family protein [Kiritimatiellae bacterium]|nr:NAD-dependent epimerase/dehydratase family protein [Kiritimatiellia bacterium]
MKILALGAGGFIGSHLTERLLRDGYAVTGVDTHSDKLTDALKHPSFTFVATDIADRRFDLDAAVRAADLVIDLIAYANPGLYIRMPLEVFRLNFTENLRIAESCVRHGRRLIQFSSCEVYGKSVAGIAAGDLADPDDPKHATFNEEESPMIMGPVGKHRWIYASAKSLLERVLHAYGLEGRLDYTIVRPFNFIGPRIDYLPSQQDGIPRVFSYFMDALLNGGRMLLVDGGRQRRTYTHIADAVDCIARMVARPGAAHNQIFNVGARGNEVSIRGLAELMREIYAARFRLPGQPLAEIAEVSGREFYGEGYDDSDRRIPDIAKARSLLGWEPRYDLRATLDDAMGYYVAMTRGQA